MFLLNDILLSAGLSALVVAVGLFLWEWSREHYRFIVASFSTFLGFAAWNILQSNTGADQALNIDWPIFPLSWSDVGSGVAAFAITAIALGLLTERTQPAWRVMIAAGMAGLLATLVDLFLL
jgi:hypothetical protein